MTDRNGLFSLAGRVALVTGGSRGIGMAIAAAFVAQGARVYISARSAEQCALAVAEIGGDCHALPHDISTTGGARALAADLAGREAALDILVNNAGVAWGEPFESHGEKGWDKVMNLNVKGLFFLTQALHPMLKAAAASGRPAKVINISSVDGIRLNGLETYAYHASKAAVIQLTRRMAARLIQDNIVVSSIAPGAFASNMNRAARDRAEDVARQIPAGRIGNADDLAGAAIFLAARSGDYVVGSTLILDGGVVNAQLGADLA